MLKTALALLERESGPVLVDYLEEVPHGSDAMLENDMTGMVCPIDRPRILGVDPSSGDSQFRAVLRSSGLDARSHHYGTERS